MLGNFIQAIKNNSIKKIFITDFILHNIVTFHPVVSLLRIAVWYSYQVMPTYDGEKKREMVY